MFETFKLHFERTANELAEQDRDPTLVGLTVSKRQFERWYGGEVKTRPYPALCRVLEAMFRYPVDVLLGPADHGGAAVDAVPQLRLVMPTPSPSPSLEPSEGDSGFDGIEFTSRPDPGDSAGRDTLERQVAMAARRAFRFSAMAEGSNVGPETLDELHQEVRRLAAAYPRLPLTPLLGDLVEVQDLTFRFLEHGHVRPIQARELYLLSAITSGMLAKASHDLGDPRSAMTQARTAYVCADNADHPAMRAWVRGLQSLIAYWDGRHQEAAKYAALGISQMGGVTGTSSVWLSCLQARAGAALGDVAAVRESLAEAERARDAASPDDLDEFGGIMTFPVPRQLYYAADATAWLPNTPRRNIRQKRPSPPTAKRNPKTGHSATRPARTPTLPSPASTPEISTASTRPCGPFSTYPSTSASTASLPRCGRSTPRCVIPGGSPHPKSAWHGKRSRRSPRPPSPPCPGNTARE
ncbi:hypothetical protein [Streptomyces sp. 2224.1]|uniref:hypothetical protein n=1 Tax=Streptomyces sp. 2224.1 TaxID=1881020 RepID=UPI001C40ACB1|nr:hypothetical protein [Streptomyces sp. 2224.1]